MISMKEAVAKAKKFHDDKTAKRFSDMKAYADGPLSRSIEMAADIGHYSTTFQLPDAIDFKMLTKYLEEQGFSVVHEVGGRYRIDWFTEDMLR